MKAEILALREQGKSYRTIEKELHCSRSLISYYVNPRAKEKRNARQNKNRFIKRKGYKELLGGKCSICGYDKCLDALHFHHTNPDTKSFNVTDAIWGNGSVTDVMLRKEVEKCILVCANCHAEIHAAPYA